MKKLERLGHRELFTRVGRERFAPAAAAFLDDPSNGWPVGLRVKSVANTPGVWEMTWSKNNPDGRATFQWITIDGEPAIKWRRVGGHEIFKDA